MKYIKYLPVILFFLLTAAASAEDAKRPIVIGLSAEFGVKDSLAAQSIEKGILLAIDEINRGGGLLGGRKLKLETRDDRGVPARGQDNLKELAANPDLIALFSGRFSPVTIEIAPIANKLGVLLLAPWSAADDITKQAEPNYVFRLSLTDTWAIDAMLDYARRHGYRQVALLVPNTAWGRSCEAAVIAYQKRKEGVNHITLKYNWGETDFRNKLQEAINFGAKAIVMVSNESEGVPIVQQMADLPVDKRLPIISHWGILGGDFAKSAGETLQSVNLVVVQSFTFNDAKTARVKSTADGIQRLFGHDVKSLHAQVGFAHAYDLTHLLALAITKAGTDDRAAVRNAMEQLGSYDGLVRSYHHPFSRFNHEALDRNQLFFGRFDKFGNVKRINEK